MTVNRGVAFTAGPAPTRISMTSTATTTTICLICRKAASALSCEHRKLRCPHARAPRKHASTRRWKQFLAFLNGRAQAGACRWEDGERITGVLTLQSGAPVPPVDAPEVPNG